MLTTILVKNNSKVSSFHKTIIFLCLLAFAMCFGSFYLASSLSEGALQTRIKEVNEDNWAKTRFVEENVRQVLSKANILLLLMKQDTEKFGYIPPDRLELLKDNLKGSSFDNIIVAGPEGNVIISAAPNMPLGNISKLENFQWHLQNESKDMYIAHPRVNQILGNQSIIVSLRVNDIQGRFAGMVSIALSKKHLNSAYMDMNLEEGSNIVLLQQDGSYIFRVPEINNNERVEKYYRSHPVIAMAANGDSKGTFENLSEIDGIIRLGAFRVMTGYPFVILATTSKVSALEEVSILKENYQYVAMVFSALLLLSLAVALWQMYRQLRMTAELKEKQQQLEYTSHHDQLTGLFNRYFLEEIVDKAIAFSDRYDAPLSMILFDLDHFKKVNDTWGHPVGDAVLKKTAEIAEAMLRESDIIVRIGGEEFIVILPNKNDSDALEVAERIRLAMDNYEHHVAGRVTASFGVVRRLKSEPFLQCYRRLDDALYRAKEEGRNRVVEAKNKIDSLLGFVKLEWHNEYESGHLEIDQQHRQLIEDGSRLVDMSISGAEIEYVLKALEQLIEDAGQHFEYEEKVLAQIGYPYYKEHGEVHKGLMEKILTLKGEYLKGRINPGDFFSMVVDDFIVGHMQQEDVKFFAYTCQYVGD